MVCYFPFKYVFVILAYPSIKAIVCSNWRFLFPSRRRQTSALFLPLMYSGSKAEKEEITITRSEAVTGLLHFRGWTCQPSQLRSSDQTCPTSEPTWGLQHPICCDADSFHFTFRTRFSQWPHRKRHCWSFLVTAVHRVYQQREIKL